MSGLLPTSPIFNAIQMRSTHTSIIDFSRSRKRNARQVGGGHLWSFIARYPRLERADFEAINAFMESQEGQYGVFNIIVPGLSVPRGVATGAPKINGGSQTGKTLNTKGWSPSVTNIMRAGDILTIAGDLKVYKITSDVNSDGSGLATLSLNTPLRKVPSDNADITVTNAMFTVSQVGETQVYDVEPPLIYSIEIDVIETL